jgi:hypothetical protein
MSLRFGSLGLFFSLVALVYAANRADDESARTARGPASIAAMHKEEKLGLMEAPIGPRHTEKVRGPLSVKLEVMSGEPKVGDTFVLRGTISSRRTLESAGYQWSVPKGVEVVNGELTGTVAGVASEQPAYVELTLRKLTDDNQQVHLLAGSVMGNTSFGDSAQFNTDIPAGGPTAIPSKATVGGIEVVPSGNKAGELKIFH